MLPRKTWVWICNILPKFVIPNLGYNLLMNLHNQQTWSPDHCFEPHLPSHLALYKKMEIPLQTFTRKTNNKLEHIASLEAFQLIPHPPLVPCKFPGSCTLSLKNSAIWHPPALENSNKILLGFFRYYLEWRNVVVWTHIEFCSVKNPFPIIDQ